MTVDPKTLRAACAAIAAAYPKDVVLDLHACWFGDASPREKRLSEAYRETFSPDIVKMMFVYYTTPEQNAAE